MTEFQTRLEDWSETGGHYKAGQLGNSSAPSDFEIIEQRVKLPPQEIRLAQRLSAARLEDKSRLAVADERFEQDSNIRVQVQGRGKDSDTHGFQSRAEPSIPASSTLLPGMIISKIDSTLV